MDLFASMKSDTLENK